MTPVFVFVCQPPTQDTQLGASLLSFEPILPLEGRRSEIIRLNLIWIIPAKEIMHPKAIQQGAHADSSRDTMDPVDPVSEVEKVRPPVSLSGEEVNHRQPHGGSVPGLESHVKAFEQTLVNYKLEIRGIQRVEEHEKVQIGWLAYLQVFGMWLSINLVINNIALGMLGPAVYELSFRDASLCAVFGAIIGSVPVAWIATWGPFSGLRSMVG